MSDKQVAGKRATMNLDWAAMLASDTHVAEARYASKAVQPWHAMEAWMTPEQFDGFLLGNVIKYVAGCDGKGGVKDMRKARHYLDRLIEHREAGQ